jgi:hypothetical protein
MIDFYLKFPDEATAKAVLYRIEGVTEESEGYEVPNFQNIDTIGTIYKNVGTEENPDMQALDGWHVNVRLVGEDVTPLEPFRVYPDTPNRVWA